MAMLCVHAAFYLRHLAASKSASMRAEERMATASRDVNNGVRQRVLRPAGDPR